jgi:GAF domain-containing protein
MDELEQLATLEPHARTPEAICAAVAKTFRVKKTEVALLTSSGSLLKFLYPAELRTMGVIPLSSTAVAARTARTRRAELFNSFARVQHSSVFEVVKLGEGSDHNEVIQKLMSAPVFSPADEVLGVIQVSRKGRSAKSAGPDFTPEELGKLKSVAATVGTLIAQQKE